MSVADAILARWSLVKIRWTAEFFLLRDLLAELLQAHVGLEVVVVEQLAVIDAFLAACAGDAASDALRPRRRPPVAPGTRRRTANTNFAPERRTAARWNPRGACAGSGSVLLRSESRFGTDTRKNLKATNYYPFVHQMRMSHTPVHHPPLRFAFRYGSIWFGYATLRTSWASAPGFAAGLDRTRTIPDLPTCSTDLGPRESPGS